MTAKRVSQKVPESGVLRACLDLLGYSKIWHMRTNTVGNRVMKYTSKKTGKEKRGVIRGLKKGTADILAIANNRGYLKVIWIECKSDTGCQKDDQKEFQREVLEAGHFYLLVRDVDTLRDWLKTHGAATNER